MSKTNNGMLPSASGGSDGPKCDVNVSAVSKAVKVVATKKAIVNIA